MEVPEEEIVLKERLHPGKMLLVDTVSGKIFWDKDLKAIYTLVQLGAFSNNAVNREVVNKMTLVGKTYGYSAALAWIYFACMLLVTGVTFLLLRDKGGKR